MHVSMYVCTHARIYFRAYMFFACACVYVLARLRIGLYTCMYLLTSMNVFVYDCMYLCVLGYTYMCVFVCMKTFMTVGVYMCA